MLTLTRPGEASLFLPGDCVTWHIGRRIRWWQRVAWWSWRALAGREVPAPCLVVEAVDPVAGTLSVGLEQTPPLEVALLLERAHRGGD